MKLVLTFVLLFNLLCLTAQKEAQFRLELSTDSVLMENYFEVIFILENASGKNFFPPNFENFQIIGGPNTSSSMSVVNGEVSQSIRYTYFLKPNDIGSFYIPPASIEVDEKILESEPIAVSVFPNPDGIQQNPSNNRKQVERYDPFDNDFFREFNRRFSTPAPPVDSTKQKKKKRVTKKI